jgi:hypothetical protein
MSLYPPMQEKHFIRLKFITTESQKNRNREELSQFDEEHLQKNLKLAYTWRKSNDCFQK